MYSTYGTGKLTYPVGVPGICHELGLLSLGLVWGDGEWG